MSELTKDSRTTSRKIDHTETEASMQVIKKDLDAMTLADFPLNLSSPVDGLIMTGCYGDNSPQKTRKRGSNGL